MVTLDYLIPDFRLRIGDTNASAYRYLDEWLLGALNSAVKYLSMWWSYKYLINSLNQVSRNSSVRFKFPEEQGIIQQGDDQIIILVAAILLLQGDFQNASWGRVSWRDAEISASFQEASRSQSEVLKSLFEQLKDMLPPPMKKLARTIKGNLPGYYPSGASGFEKDGKW